MSSSLFLNEIRALNRKNTVKKIIIGYLKISNQLGRQTINIQSNIEAVREIEKMLEKEGFEVEMESEDFSSAMAQENLKEKRARNISTADDTEAARIILQSWLDRQA